MGISDFILSVPEYSNVHVFVGHDHRHLSRQFASEAAQVFKERLGARRACQVHLFDEPLPTPLLAWAAKNWVNEPSATVFGVQVTASHNPAQYNGYKVYGPSGSQIDEHMAKGIAKFIQDVPIAGLAIRFQRMSPNESSSSLATRYSQYLKKFTLWRSSGWRAFPTEASSTPPCTGLGAPLYAGH